jgi:hypothetical protein
LTTNEAAKAIGAIGPTATIIARSGRRVRMRLEYHVLAIHAPALTALKATPNAMPL